MYFSSTMPGWDYPRSGYQTPSQEIAPFYASNVQSAISEYRNLLQGLTRGSEAYDLTARPVTWQDVQAQQVSATGAAREAMSFNEENMGRYTSMAQELTRADLSTRTSMLDQFVPDWRQKRDAASAINDSLMRGEIPKDVADQLKRTAAFTSVMGGGGAGTQRALTARDLGTTSLALQEKGMQGAERWTTMMANLMPEQTRATDIMATQGLSSSQTLQTALANAQAQLGAATTNVQGRTKTALEVESMRLGAEEAKAMADRGAAQIQATGFGNILSAQAGLETQKYNVAQAAAEAALANMASTRPSWQTQRTGMYSSVTYPTYRYGQGSSASAMGFGIR
jgi:hypothetical protein